MTDAVPPEVPGVADLVVIGRGGFGVVYRGRQADLSRDVAVKVLLAPGADPKAVERWRREITAMGRLSNHPNIVAVYSAGVTDEGHPYLLMPYLAAGSLHERIVRSGPLDGDEAIRIGVRLSGGLATAHSAGVLHRDLKPANVLLSEYGEPQLSDFGIARLVDSATTTTGSVTATIGYAAPEVLSGEQATPAADVYGLAATLHASLSGQAPFAGIDGEPMMSRVGRVLTQPPPDLRALGVAPDLAALLEAGLAKDPADRPPTAEALGEALEALEALDGGTDGSTATVVAPAAGPPPERTAVLAPIAAAAAATAVEPAATTVAPSAPAPPGDGPAPQPPPGRGRGALIAAGLVVLLLLVAGAGFLLTRDGGDGGDEVTADTTASTTTSAAPPETEPPVTEPPATEPPATEPPATEPEATTTIAPPDGEVTAEDLEAATTSYYGVVGSGDLEASYALLSPRYQQEQPFDGYRQFWTQDVESVEIQGRPQGDADALTTDLTLRYGRPDGSESVEDVRLTFVTADDGSLLIDDYEVTGGGSQPADADEGDEGDKDKD